MNAIQINQLEDIGYSNYFEAGRKNLGFSDYPVARVSAEYKEAYRIITADGAEYLAKVTGKRMFTATTREDYPAVGDWIVYEKLPEDKAIIRAILPRKSTLSKKYSDKQDNQIIATNIDTAFIVESVDRDFNLNRLERYLVLCQKAHIYPVIVLNKIDLNSDEDLESKKNQLKHRFKDTHVILTSTVMNSGMDELSASIEKGKTYCFLGSSGTGKSSLISKLLGSEKIKTGEISSSIERGRHTTTTREMYILENGGIVIDNPGTREVGIADADNSIKSVFDEIDMLSRECKFSDCTHVCEQGCAVLKAIEEGKLDKDQYANYNKLKKEAAFYRMTDVEKREKDRKFGKYVKKILQELKQ